MASGELAAVLDRIDRLNVNWSLTCDALYNKETGLYDGKPTKIRFYEEYKEGVMTGEIYSDWHDSVSARITMNGRDILNVSIYLTSWHDFAKKSDRRYIKDYFEKIAVPLYEQELSKRKTAKQEEEKRKQQAASSFWSSPERPDTKDPAMPPDPELVKTLKLFDNLRPDWEIKYQSGDDRFARLEFSQVTADGTVTSELNFGTSDWNGYRVWVSVRLNPNLKPSPAIVILEKYYYENDQNKTEYRMVSDYRYNLTVWKNAKTVADEFKKKYL